MAVFMEALAWLLNLSIYSDTTMTILVIILNLIFREAATTSTKQFNHISIYLGRLLSPWLWPSWKLSWRLQAWLLYLSIHSGRLLPTWHHHHGGYHGGYGHGYLIIIILIYLFREATTTMTISIMEVIIEVTAWLSYCNDTYLIYSGRLQPPWPSPSWQLPCRLWALLSI